MQEHTCHHAYCDIFDVTAVRKEHAHLLAMTDEDQLAKLVEPVPVKRDKVLRQA